MSSPEISKNSSFYQLACHTTDTFTSCIRIYEALLPYFEAERPDDAISRRLFNIGGMLITLYSELTTLKKEITTTSVAVHDNNHNVLKPVVESKSLTKLPNEHKQQKNICEARTVEQKEPCSEKVLDKLSERSLEDIRQVLGEEYQREKSKHKDNMMEKTPPHNEELLIKPTQSNKNQASNFEYICGNCSETITVYNQDLDLSIALHTQDGYCRGNPVKLMQKERQEEKVDVLCAQGQIQNSINYQKATNRLDLDPTKTDTVYKVEDTHFSCIRPFENRFICTVCNKYLGSPTQFDEHVQGNYHQKCLKQSSKEINKSTDYETEVTCDQAIKSCENNSPDSVVQEKSVLSQKVKSADIIESLLGTLYSQRQYFSVENGLLMCNLCDREIPQSSTSVTDHVLGKRHLTNLNKLFSQFGMPEIK